MLRAVVGALVKSVRRDLAGYAAIKTNHFFLFVGLLVAARAVLRVGSLALSPVFWLVVALLAARTCEDSGWLCHGCGGDEMWAGREWDRRPQ